MIRDEMKTRVYYVSLGGFDTHANQTGAHGNLMRQLGDSLQAFYNDLKAQGNQERVLTMVFSEFGRRVAQNASGGTDHGTAAPMYFIGDMVRPGLLGDHPSLSKLEPGRSRLQRRLPLDLFRGPRGLDARRRDGYPRAALPQGEDPQGLTQAEPATPDAGPSARTTMNRFLRPLSLLIAAPALTILPLACTSESEETSPKPAPGPAATSPDTSSSAAPVIDEPAREIELVALRYRVTGMHCGGCANGIKGTLVKLDGVVECEVSFEESRADVRVDDPALASLVEEQIRKLGYEVEPITDES